MAIVVEDGTGSNPAANSYSSLAEIRDYAVARGVVLPSDDSVLEPLAHKAMDWLEGLRNRYKGMKTSAFTNQQNPSLPPVSQPLQWPRACVVIDGSPLPSNVIPAELKAAEAQLCIEQFNSIDISPTRTGFAVTLEKVDVLEVRYATGGTSQAATQEPLPIMTTVDNLVAPLLRGNGMMLTTFRV